MDIDEVYHEVVGEYGPHQKKLFWFLCFSQAYLAFHQIHNVFLAAEPDFMCKVGPSYFDGCPKIDKTCESYDFSKSAFKSIVTEWDLVCDNSYKASLVQSAYMAGLMIGSMSFGTVADMYGRKKVFFTLPAISIFTIVGSLSSSHLMYILCRFISGIFVGGWLVVSFVLTTEFVGSSQRGFVATVQPMMFALGIIVFSGVAYLISSSWRWLTFASAVPGLLGISFYWIIPESPRWLYCTGRLKEAQYLLEDFYRKNYATEPEIPIKLRSQAATPNESTSSGDDNTGLLVIIKNPILRKRTLINIYTWFVCCAVYYGLTFAAGSLGGSMYMSVSLSGVVEIPAYLITWYLIDRLGRRYTFSGSLLIGGVFCLGILLIPKGSLVMKNAIGLTGKCCISIAFCVQWIYSAEMYPTTIRNKGLSICNFFARLGGVVSPMILTLGKVYPNLEFVIFGAMTFLAGILGLWLPETANQPMPETVDDLTQDHSAHDYQILKKKDSFEGGHLISA